MKIQYPDYENSIANLACSVLKAFGAEAEHATLPFFSRRSTAGLAGTAILRK